MFKTITTTLTALVMTASPSMAESIETIKGYRHLDRGHNELVQSILDTGISTQLNVGSNCRGGADGTYYPTRRILSVCQDNAPRPHWGEVRWTANDLDTLRHEAHHIVQDCAADGRIGGKIGPMFQDETKFWSFVKRGLSKTKGEWIVKNYSAKGADEVTVLMELEAFAVADNVAPTVIAASVRKYCM